MTLEELMARLDVIANEMTEFQKIENLSEDQVKTVNELSSEAITIKAQVEAKKSIESTIANSNQSTRVTEPVKPVLSNTVSVGEERRMQNGMGGFDSVGKFFMAVKDQARGGNFDERLKAIQQQEKVGADGGFMIPADLIAGIQKKVEGDESLLSRCRQFRTSSNRIELLVNENAPWDQTGETIRANWIGEGVTIPNSKTKIKEVEIKLHKLAAIVNVTEEMLEDSALIESYISGEVPEVMNATINNAIISGNGVKKPEGILNSGFGFEVAKEGSQLAATINFENVKKLYTHLLPSSKRNAMVLYNVSAEEQLIGMQLDPASTDSVSVYLPNNSAAGSPFGTLWGRPVMPMSGAMQALGQPMDIAMIDFSKYYAALKTSGIRNQMSIHAKWEEDIASFRFIFRVGGKCPFVAPQETEYGAYKLSGFTYLQLRD